jgi:ribose transport system permease protein
VSTGLRGAWQSAVPFGALIAVCLIFAVTAPGFVSYDNAVNVVGQSAVLLVIALGSAFVILMGSIDLSVGAIASLTGIVAAKLAPHHGAWALLAAVALGLGVGAGNGLIFTVLRIPSFLVTLGTMSILSGVALQITSGVPVTITSPEFLSLSNRQLISTLPAVAFWGMGAFFISVWVATRTRFGRYVYAIGGAERTARISGIPVQRFKLYAFALSGLLAGLAGGLLAAYQQSGSPTAGQGYLLTAIAAVVMGGIPLTGGYGGIGRTLLGVAILGVLSNGLNLAGVGPYTQDVIQGAVIIVAVAFSLDRSKLSALK